MTEPRVILTGVGKCYRVYRRPLDRLLDITTGGRRYEEFWAVREISFQAFPGQAYGVIGENGAGKSTLLRLLTRTSDPTAGRVEIRGRMMSLLDVSGGFHRDFSGVENIRINCAIQGLSREETEALVPAISAYAELDAFIGKPIRTYSMGMVMRLAFAIATTLQADVLVLDEVLAVGDRYFMRKCIKRIQELLGAGTTLVFVSHDLHAVRSLCDEVLWLKGGRERMKGPAEEVVAAYVDYVRSRDGQYTGGGVGDLPTGPAAEGSEDGDGPPEWGDDSGAAPAGTSDSGAGPAAASEPPVVDPKASEAGGARGKKPRHRAYEGMDGVTVLDCRFVNKAGETQESFATFDYMAIELRFRAENTLVNPTMGFAIFRNDGVYVHGPNTMFDGALRGEYNGEYMLRIVFPAVPLLHGTYQVSVSIYDEDHLNKYIFIEREFTFKVKPSRPDHGLVILPHYWTVERSGEPG